VPWVPGATELFTNVPELRYPGDFQCPAFCQPRSTACLLATGIDGARARRTFQIGHEDIGDDVLPGSLGGSITRSFSCFMLIITPRNDLVSNVAAYSSSRLFCPTKRAESFRPSLLTASVEAVVKPLDRLIPNKVTHVSSGALTSVRKQCACLSESLCSSSATLVPCLSSTGAQVTRGANEASCAPSRPKITSVQGGREGIGGIPMPVVGGRRIRSEAVNVVR